MRFLIAFFISLLIYILFIWLYITEFSKITLPIKRAKEHIIKIDIRNILPPKKIEIQKKVIAPVVIKAKSKSKLKPVKKKKIIKKKKHKKKRIKKKVVKKRVVKPKVKKIIKKKIVKKVVKPKKRVTTVVQEEILMPTPIIDNDLLMQSFEVIEPIPEVKRTPIKENSDDLASFLSVPDNSVGQKSYPNRKIEKLYGSTFHTFTPTQKSFIEENLDDIQSITQRVLSQRGYPEGAGRTHQEGTNVVSFNLHPNGTISNLRLQTRIGYRALDDNTLSLIRTAYREYPYPSTTTRIIFYVEYSIYGY